MNRLNNRFLFIIPLFLFLGITWSSANVELREKRIEVAMRMIGHELLLHVGDSTSRVLAITNEDNKYKIRFESAFEFDSDALVDVVQEVFTQVGIYDNYFAEVVEVDSKAVVYSFEALPKSATDMIPCQGRNYPHSEYELLITLHNEGAKLSDLAPAVIASRPLMLPFLFVGILIVLFIVGFFFYRKKTSKSRVVDSHIKVGQYVLDTKNMRLKINQETTTLTHKEMELLLLLHHSANQILERDEMLQKVWGDDGDYVGRTLDVFISKLRKKIAGDANLKIINIRGTGYKLVVN